MTKEWPAWAKVGSGTLLLMQESHYCLVELDFLNWPCSIHVPAKRFRLFVAADISSLTTETITQFAHAALKAGMVYFSAWGPDCERFHDLVDEVIVADDIGDRHFTGPNKTDTIMTTWHKNEALDEALDFFINSAVPTAGFEPDSYCWLAVCVNNHQWANTIRRQLGQAEPIR